MLRQILCGKSSLSNGFLALAIIGLIVLGCTCNDKTFDFGKKDDSNSTNKTEETPTETPKEKKEIVKSDASKGNLPEDDELEAIVKETLLDFDKAVKKGDFTEFYENTSDPFQKSITPKGLKDKFKQFIDGNADVSKIEDLEPKYTTEPKVSKTRGVNVLEAKGEFPTSPRPTEFDLKYIPEGKEWKLISFAVYTTVYQKR